METQGIPNIQEQKSTLYEEPGISTENDMLQDKSIICEKEKINKANEDAMDLKEPNCWYYINRSKETQRLQEPLKHSSNLSRSSENDPRENLATENQRDLTSHQTHKPTVLKIKKPPNLSTQPSRAAKPWKYLLCHLKYTSAFKTTTKSKTSRKRNT